ncbi:ferrochelatase [Natronocella acetinitrilica]|uniref:Ferrochelatase n=1 Tax=Natronocella acetinitrilica TaxID=414046 RepID=A0AAE3KAG4_9GAMM|nr:ferrochelatase [Natronocella acetinitrilica]MCP1673504.1 ferrochelatase [Natronocella acetinitrilica]
MPRFSAKDAFKHDDTPRLGVLVANLGTPDAPTAPALRTYLAQFLADPRVVEVPRLLWRIILHGIVLRTRPAKSARAYAEVWTDEGSPLLVISRAQTEGIAQRLHSRLEGPVAVELGMRYGSPSIPKALQTLRQAGAERLLVLPMYPQYSGATTASTFDALADELKGWRWVPELRFIGQYHDDPAYIACLAASIREHWEAHGRGDKLLFSFHGTPQRYLLDGDPYHCQCQKTARLVAQSLQLPDDAWQVTFQSRFGREVWLQPYTDKTVEALGKSGLKTLDVICAGFSADCLETLEEIQGENAEIFEEAGGGELRYIAALNDRSDHLDMLTDLILSHAQGWPEAGGGARGRRDTEETGELATAQGAES